eukprot:scaffold54195_cov58-Attheya_sp.AAC.2
MDPSGRRIDDGPVEGMDDSPLTELKWLLLSLAQQEQQQEQQGESRLEEVANAVGSILISCDQDKPFHETVESSSSNHVWKPLVREAMGWILSSSSQQQYDASTWMRSWALGLLGLVPNVEARQVLLDFLPYTLVGLTHANHENGEQEDTQDGDVLEALRDVLLLDATALVPIMGTLSQMLAFQTTSSCNSRLANEARKVCLASLPIVPEADLPTVVQTLCRSLVVIANDESSSKNKHCDDEEDGSMAKEALQKMRNELSLLPQTDNRHNMTLLLGDVLFSFFTQDDEEDDFMMVPSSHEKNTTGAKTVVIMETYVTILEELVQQACSSKHTRDHSCLLALDVMVLVRLLNDNETTFFGDRIKKLVGPLLKSSLSVSFFRHLESLVPLLLQHGSAAGGTLTDALIPRLTYMGLYCLLMQNSSSHHDHCADNNNTDDDSNRDAETFLIKLYRGLTRMEVETTLTTTTARLELVHSLLTLCDQPFVSLFTTTHTVDNTGISYHHRKRRPRPHTNESHNMTFASLLKKLSSRAAPSQDNPTSRIKKGEQMMHAALAAGRALVAMAQLDRGTIARHAHILLSRLTTPLDNNDDGDTHDQCYGDERKRMDTYALIDTNCAILASLVDYNTNNHGDHTYFSENHGANDSGMDPSEALILLQKLLFASTSQNNDPMNHSRDGTIISSLHQDPTLTTRGLILATHLLKACPPSSLDQQHIIQWALRVLIPPKHNKRSRAVPIHPQIGLFGLQFLQNAFSSVSGKDSFPHLKIILANTGLIQQQSQERPLGQDTILGFTSIPSYYQQCATENDNGNSSSPLSGAQNGSHAIQKPKSATRDMIFCVASYLKGNNVKDWKQTCRWVFQLVDTYLRMGRDTSSKKKSSSWKPDGWLLASIELPSIYIPASKTNDWKQTSFDQQLQVTCSLGISLEAIVLESIHSLSGPEYDRCIQSILDLAYASIVSIAVCCAVLRNAHHHFRDLKDETKKRTLQKLMEYQLAKIYRLQEICQSCQSILFEACSKKRPQTKQTTRRNRKRRKAPTAAPKPARTKKRGRKDHVIGHHVERVMERNDPTDTEMLNMDGVDIDDVTTTSHYADGLDPQPTSKHEPNGRRKPESKESILSAIRDFQGLVSFLFDSVEFFNPAMLWGCLLDKDECQILVSNCESLANNETVGRMNDDSFGHVMHFRRSLLQHLSRLIWNAKGTSFQSLSSTDTSNKPDDTKIINPNGVGVTIRIGSTLSKLLHKIRKHDETRQRNEKTTSNKLSGADIFFKVRDLVSSHFRVLYSIFVCLKSDLVHRTSGDQSLLNDTLISMECIDINATTGKGTPASSSTNTTNIATVEPNSSEIEKATQSAILSKLKGIIRFLSNLAVECEDAGIACLILDLLSVLADIGGQSLIRHVKETSWKMIYTVYGFNSDVEYSPSYSFARVVSSCISKEERNDGTAASNDHNMVIAGSLMKSESVLLRGDTDQLVLRHHLLSYWSLMVQSGSDCDGTCQELRMLIEELRLVMDCIGLPTNSSYKASSLRSKSAAGGKVKLSAVSSVTSIPTLSGQSYPVFFELMLHIVISTFALSSPTVRTSNQLPSAVDRKTDHTSLLQSPYRFIQYLAVTFGRLLDLYSNNNKLLPRKTLTTVMNGCTIMVKASESVVRKCVEWRNARPLLTMEEQQMGKLDIGAVRFLQMLIDTVVSECVCKIISMCELMRREAQQRNKSKQNVSNDDDDYSDEEDLGIQGQGWIFAVNHKKINNLLFRCKKLFKALQDVASDHNLVTPSLRRMSPENHAIDIYDVLDSARRTNVGTNNKHNLESESESRNGEVQKRRRIQPQLLSVNNSSPTRAETLDPERTVNLLDRVTESSSSRNQNAVHENDSMENDMSFFDNDIESEDSESDDDSSSSAFGVKGDWGKGEFDDDEDGSVDSDGSLELQLESSQ